MLDQKEGSVETSSAQASAVLSKACVRCRQLKLACRRGDEDEACSRCADAGHECEYVARKRGPTTPSLTRKLIALEEELGRIRQDVQAAAEMRHRMDVFEAQLQRVLPRDSGPPMVVVTPTVATGSARLPPTGFSPLVAPLSDPVSAHHVDDAADEEAINEIEHGDLPVTGSIREPHGPLYDVAWRQDKGWATDSLDPALETGCRMAFEIFDTSCKPALTFCDPNDPAFRFDVARNLSPLFFWSIVAVGSRGSKGLEDVFDISFRHMTDCLSNIIMGNRTTFWDLSGAVIRNKYLASIKHLGQLVDLAYDCGVHASFKNMKDTPSLQQVCRRDCRIWVAIWIQDHFASSLTGRPPFISDTAGVAQQAQWLVQMPDALPNDRRLVASFEYEAIVRSLLTDAETVSEPGWPQILSERLDAIEAWFGRWYLVGANQSTTDEMSPMLSAMKVNYHLARLVTNSLILRGQRKTALSPAHTRYLQASLDCARALCQLCHDEFQPPRIMYTGEPMIYAFVTAGVFILKANHLSPALVTGSGALEEVQRVVDVISHLSQKSHARMLRSLLHRARASPQADVPALPDLNVFDTLAWPNLTHDEPFDVSGMPFHISDFPGIDDIFGLNQT